MPKSIYKSTNSLQNVILLLLFVIGLFVLYRYVKTIETETKMLHNHLIELTEKIQLMSARQMPSPPPLPSFSTDNQTSKLSPLPENAAAVNQKAEEVVDDDDNDSIKSEDITAMLKKVMGGGATSVDDECIDNIMIQVARDEMNDMMRPPSSTVIEDITDAVEADKGEDPVVVDGSNKETIDDTASTKSNNVLNLDDDTLENTRDTLMRKTNEELKGMLKQRQLPIKGSKQDLVDRLMNGA